MGSLFQEKTHSELWKSHDLELDPRITKFRNIQCSSGDHAWTTTLIWFMTWSYKHE